MTACQDPPQALNNDCDNQLPNNHYIHYLKQDDWERVDRRVFLCGLLAWAHNAHCAVEERCPSLEQEETRNRALVWMHFACVRLVPALRSILLALQVAIVWGRESCFGAVERSWNPTRFRKVEIDESNACPKSSKFPSGDDHALGTRIKVSSSWMWVRDETPAPTQDSLVLASLPWEQDA